MVRTSRCIVELVDAEHKRGKTAGAGLDLSCRSEAQHLAHSIAAVSLRQPTPMCEGAVIDRLDNYGISVLNRVKAVKVVRPKDRTKRFRQLGVHAPITDTAALRRAHVMPVRPRHDRGMTRRDSVGLKSSAPIGKAYRVLMGGVQRRAEGLLTVGQLRVCRCPACEGTSGASPVVLPSSSSSGLQAAASGERGQGARACVPGR